MKKLKWIVTSDDIWGNVRQYSAFIEYKITDSIDIYLHYLVHMGNDDEWYFSVIQTSPHTSKTPSWVKCYNPEIGKKMAEDEFKKLVNGFKKFVNDMDEK